MPTTYNWSAFVDVIFERGLLFLAIRNNSSDPVFNVKTKFLTRIKFPPMASRPPLPYLTDLPVFQNILFLAPHKEIRVFLDGYVSYMMTGQPMELKMTVEFDTPAGEHIRNNIFHNLEIYRGVGYIEWPDDQIATQRSAINAAD